MIRIALCDDDPIFEKSFKHFLDSYSVSVECDLEYRYFSTSKELLSTSYIYDILFLDIMLENAVDGISLGIQLRSAGNNAVFILVTSREDRYKEGYKATVQRFLTKPIQKVELYEALDSAFQHFEVADRKLTIQFKNAISLVAFKDIIMVESYNRKRIIYTLAETHQTTEPWDALLAKFPVDHFFRPHKYVLINFNYITSSTKSKIILKNNKIISLARGNYEMFNQAFQHFLGEPLL